jgi:hypothetical protein
MPIYRMFDAPLILKAWKCLASPLKSLLTEIKLTVRTDPLTILVAQRIIEFAKGGERDPVELRRRVLDSLE